MIHVLTALFFCTAVFFIDFDSLKLSRIFFPVLMGISASLCTLNGLIIWPTLVLLLWAGKSSWRIILYYSLIGLIVIMIYSRGLLIDMPKETVLFRHRVAYFFVFLSSVFNFSLKYTKYFGLAGLAAYFICIYLTLRENINLIMRRHLLRWLALAGLSIGSAVLGMLGRAYISVLEAAVSRYIVFSMWLWIAILVVSLFFLEKFFNKKFYKIIAVFIGFVLLISYSLAVIRPARDFDNKIPLGQVMVTNLALSQNTYIVNPVFNYGYLYLTPIKALEGLAFLKQKKLVPFNVQHEIVLGKNMTDLGFKMVSEKLEGSLIVAAIEPKLLNTCQYGFQRSFTVQGAINNHQNIEKIYIIDKTGKIWGLGLADIWQPNKHQTRWTGFAVSSLSGSSVFLQAAMKLKNQVNPILISQKQSLPSGLSCELH